MDHPVYDFVLKQNYGIVLTYIESSIQINIFLNIDLQQYLPYNEIFSYKMDQQDFENNTQLFFKFVSSFSIFF